MFSTKSYFYMTITNDNPKKRRSIPAKTKANLQKEINSICPLCGNEDVGHFQVHHIDENPSNNTFSNLLLICPTCHSKITKGDIKPEVVLQKKISLSQENTTNQNQTTTKVNNFHAPINNAVVGDNNSVNINTTVVKKATKKVVNKYPEGSIGSDIHKKNYISHLITRYNDYKEWDVGKENMSYGLFSSNLKKRFKVGKDSAIYHVPLERFEELVNYIKSRIDGTKLAKTKGKGHKNYSSFSEYLEQSTGDNSFQNQ